MLDGACVVVTMPGIDVANTLRRTVEALPGGWVDDIVLADDGSSDNTVEVARSLGIRVFSHDRNMGYGAAQKTTYREALLGGADIVIMVHPDFQYDPSLVPAMASMVRHGGYDVVLASRMLDGGALRGGMPLYKLLANRVLTHAENLLLQAHISEYHTGYRAYSRRLLEELPIAGLSDGFVFDSEILALAVIRGYRIGELSCPANYFDEMQTMPLRTGIRYGLGCLRAAGQGWLARTGLHLSKRFTGRKLVDGWHAGEEQS